MTKLNEFRADLKSRATDFATSFQLVSGGEVRTQKQKDDINDKAYEKFEKFILETYNSWMIDGTRKVDVPEPLPNPEDTTLQLDF